MPIWQGKAKQYQFTDDDDDNDDEDDSGCLVSIKAWLI